MKRFNTRLFGRMIPVVGAVMLAATVLTMGASAATPTSFSNGFETNNAGWNVYGAQYGLQYDATRVPSSTNGVTSKTGGFHAEAFGPCALDGCGGSADTNWGGNSDTFPANGYSTSVDIYLNIESNSANDTRFDWESSISNTSGNYLRGFDFNCGYYNDTDVTGSGARFVCSASNNAGRGGAYPKNPGRSPFTITNTGWYTFQHQFHNNNGVLAVDLNILDSSGTVLKTWALSDSTDLIGSTVGGNQDGWFASQEFPFLAFDNSKLTVASVAPTCLPTGFSRDNHQLTAAQIGGNVTGPLNAAGCDIGVYYAPGTTHASVNRADISGATYYGVLVNAAAVDVTNSQIHDIGDNPIGVNPLRGMQRGVGVLYTTLDQPNEVKYQNGDKTFVKTGVAATGTLSGNTITSYQKTGVSVNGPGAAVTVQGNTVTGLGMIDFIAPNGIQISRGATGLVTGNTVSGNWYTPTPTTSCGLLFFLADGVKQKTNNLSGNETSLCNAGRGGGNTNP